MSEVSYFSCMWYIHAKSKPLRSEVRLRNSIGNSLHRCWSCMDFWTYQPRLGIGYFLFDIILAWSRYWVHLENFHTNQVLVLGTFWNLHTSLILDLGLRIETDTRPLLLQGACLPGCYWCKVDIASGHTSLVGSYLILGTGLSIYETNIGPFLCWVWPIRWILRAPIPKVEAPHQTLLDLWWSNLKLPPLDGEWGEYLLLTQPDLILRPSLWEVGLTVGAVHLNKEKLWMVAEATSQGHRRVLSPHVGIGHSF
jgi:hypothetical protein